ncbi:MAG: hypothetical protein KGI00_01795 [Candidatus Micrarchaeota archaeon]|nr:hypothetical protein [Candidatus Micrarchaeota archaeon]MDE1823868.1 hypothetical protein [Candidatus Micrarchaeota archaeon]MDE1849441.1 hypothetical protein [Candidatus Micrarchaeota archaeon]
MNKKTISGVIVLIIILGFAAYYLLNAMFFGPGQSSGQYLHSLQQEAANAVATQTIHIKSCGNYISVTDPMVAKIAPYSNVTWINDDSKNHTIWFNPNAGPLTGSIPPGGQQTVMVSLGSNSLQGYECDRNASGPGLLVS